MDLPAWAHAAVPLVADARVAWDSGLGEVVGAGAAYTAAALLAARGMLRTQACYKLVPVSAAFAANRA